MGSSNIDNNAPRLTEQQLELSINMDYQFEDLGGNNDEVKHPEEISVTPIALVQTPLAKIDEPGEDSQEEEEGDDGDDEEFNMFYDRDEIESTKEQQVYDAFEDIKEIKEDYIMSGFAGNKALNKINIDEWAPKEDELKLFLK